MGEKAKFLFNHQTEYDSEAANVVGATTDTTLRTITTPASGTTNYVRKFGNPYAIGAITNAVITTPRSLTPGPTWSYKFYNQNDTLLATVTDVDTGSSFTAGTAEASTLIYIVVEGDSAVATINDGDTISLTTDVDAPLVVHLSGETAYMNVTGDSLTWFLSSTGSTYYAVDMTDYTNEQNYMHGGYRHTPVAGSDKYPYFHPEVADAALGGGRTIVHVLDSASYQIDEYAITIASTIWQAALGQTPRLVTPIGASAERDIEYDASNNSNTFYVGKDGADTGSNGWFQAPFLTHAYAYTAAVAGSKTYIKTIDSDTYTDDNITVASTMNFEPIYSKTPIFNSSSVASSIFTKTVAAMGISGYIGNGNNVSPYFIEFDDVATDCSGTIKNNTLSSYSTDGIFLKCKHYEVSVVNNKVHSCGVNGIFVRDENVSVSGEIIKNITYGCDAGIRYGHGTSAGSDVYINNNLSYLNTQYGIFLNIGTHWTGACNNNTLLSNGVAGFYLNTNVVGAFGTMKNMVCWGNEKDLYDVGAPAREVSYTNYLTNDGFTLGAGMVTTDPQLCKESAPYRFGISSIGGGYHADVNDNTMGVNSYGLSIENSSITINGFIFDSLDSYPTAIVKNGNSNYTTHVFKWCTIQNFIGMAIDIWDNDLSLTVSILNCDINNNGQGSALNHGNNTFSESIFSKNSKIGLWVDQPSHTINHCVFYGSQYGVYSDANTAAISLKNSIINENSLYGIYSIGAAMTPTYTCITDAVTSNVDISDPTNIINSPLFINTNDGEENYRVKTIEAGFNINSPCKEAADDGYDMGAYLIDYSIIQDYWDKYTLEFNPRQMEEAYKVKGKVSYQDALGALYNWAQSHKIVLPFSWAGNSATSKEQRLMIRHFQERIPTRDNEYIEDECIFLVSLLPLSFYATGSGTVSGLTLTDSSGTYMPNEVKGWHVTIIFDSESGNINPTTKVITCGGASWTNDEWIGYFIHYNGYYYYVLDNDGTTLTVSDPNDTLSTATGVAIDITKYFKIKKNNGTALTLKDDDSELVDGTYNYRIDIIECKVLAKSFGYKQKVFDIEKDRTKSGYGIGFEER